MLSERLKNREVYAKHANEEDSIDARKLLNVCVHNLVQSMAAVERDKAMTRTEIENYVVNRMEFYEQKLYSMSDEDFNFYLALEKLQHRLGKGGRHGRKNDH